MDRAVLGPLAAVAHVSEAHFSRSFRAVFGETPHRYLQRRRVGALDVPPARDRPQRHRHLFRRRLPAWAPSAARFGRSSARRPRATARAHCPMVAPNCFQMLAMRPLVAPIGSPTRSSSSGEARPRRRRSVVGPMIHAGGDDDGTAADGRPRRAKMPKDRQRSSWRRRTGRDGRAREGVESEAKARQAGWRERSRSRRSPRCRRRIGRWLTGFHRRGRGADLSPRDLLSRDYRPTPTAGRQGRLLLHAGR